MPQFQSQDEKNLLPDSFVTLRPGFISISKLDNISLSGIGPLLQNIREITDILSVIPLAVPVDSAITISRLKDGKLQFDFFGTEVRYQILPSDSCQVLSMNGDGETSVVHIRIEGKERIIILRRAPLATSEITETSSPKIARTTNPFRSHQTKVSQHIEQDRASESRGGCGDGER